MGFSAQLRVSRSNSLASTACRYDLSSGWSLQLLVTTSPAVCQTRRTCRRRRIVQLQGRYNGDDAAVDLSTDASDGAIGNTVFIRDQNVAGGRANHFDQRIRLCARADCADVTVKRAACKRDRFGDAEPLCPLCGDGANRLFSGPGLGKQWVLQCLCQARIERV